MRILIATQNYDANGHEAAIFTVRLAEGLTRAGHGVMVIAPSATGRSGRTVHNGVLIQTVSAGLPAPLAPLSLGLRSAREMAQAIEEFGPNVVHVQDQYPLSRSVSRFARRRGLPLVATSNSLPAAGGRQGRHFRLATAATSRIHWEQASAALNTADIVTAPTRAEANALREHGIRRPVRAISAGVDLDRFSPEAAADAPTVRARYGIDPRAVVFMSKALSRPGSRGDRATPGTAFLQALAGPSPCSSHICSILV